MDHCCVTVLVLYLQMRRSERLNLMVLNNVAIRYDCDSYVSSDESINADPVPFINLSLNCLITATSPGILKRPSSLSTDSLLRYATHWTTIGWMIPWGSGSAVVHEYNMYLVGTIHCTLCKSHSPGYFPLRWETPKSLSDKGRPSCVDACLRFRLGDRKLRKLFFIELINLFPLGWGELEMGSGEI